jgi:hypothetical protein
VLGTDPLEPALADRLKLALEAYGLPVAAR